MSVTLPRDILNRLERRRIARETQTESFHTKADRLKQSATPVAEGAQPPADESEQPTREEPAMHS